MTAKILCFFSQMSFLELSDPLVDWGGILDDCKCWWGKAGDWVVVECSLMIIIFILNF